MMPMMRVNCEQAQLYCTPDRARKVIITLLVSSLAAQTIRDIVRFHTDVYRLVGVVQLCLILFNIAVPLSLLAINVIVVREARREASTAAELGRQSSLQQQQQQRSSSSSKTVVLTSMLLTTSIIHVAVCVTWFILYYVYWWTHHAELSSSTRIDLQEVHSVAEESHSFVYSPAFYVYLIRDKRFRSELRQLLCRCRSNAGATVPRRSHLDSVV